MKKLGIRLLSLLLCVAMLMAWIPMSVQADTPDDTRVADPSTMDNWKDIFLNTGSTENAGAVWTDKSVFTDNTLLPGITQDEADSFLVALSAMGSNMSVTGTSNMPTDTVIILDLSSSMYNGYSRKPETVQKMLTAVNESIDKLQKMNPNNRVGVTVYFGGQDRNQSTKDNSMVMLPLDRYTGSSTYLKANVTSGKLMAVQVNSGLKNSAGNTVTQTKRTVTDVAGTYAQLGILDALDLFLAADPTVPANASYQPGVDRVPVFIFMSDGEPTAATHKYTEKADAGMGNNTVPIRNPDETDFVTQLTAAYAKEMVDAHYVKTTPLFYSLSLGTSVSLAVMDPKGNTTSTTDGYWNSLIANGSVKISVLNSKDGWSAPTVSKTYTVKTTTVDGKTFPANKDVRNYTNKHFSADTSSQLTDAFADIITQINLVSKYHPTLTDGDNQLSGYVSFVDKVGQYMTVTDVKGILIDGMLYSGGELSKNFVPGGGDLGTYDAPTLLGDEMVRAVKARLGIDSTETARTLIGLAYEKGQLAYNGPDDYSNYIGWYANAAGEYLGFWYEGMDTLPEPTGNAATDPAYIVKSYGYLGAVDESHGVEASDMMYATVQVRIDIATGEETVVFAVPAALIPTLTYEVDLELDGSVTKFQITGADKPIRLVYEVALQEGIDAYTLTEKVSPEYLAANTGASGAVSFYTNQYEADLTVGYGKVNTYSYFNPSRENERYYYLADAPVYTDPNGTLYTGSSQPDGTFYRAYTVYTPTDAQIRYRRLSDAALETAKQRSDGTWYIPAGNVHVNLDGYTVTKSENTTDTMPDAYIPFVDAHNHSVGDLGYNFIIGATLGNNGKMELVPATGIKLTKTLADGVAPTDDTFTFTVTGNTSGTVDARLVTGDVTEDTTVTFADGEATVSLKAGQSLYITGLTPGSYTVTEETTLTYLPEKDTVSVNVTAGQFAEVNFVNGLRGDGDLTISKQIVHPLGSGYTIPGRSFTMEVTLTGLGTANATFQAEGTVTSVTTDANGRFTVTLAHNEQIRILDLPAGTVATVRESEPGDGFHVSYLENGAAGKGIVTIVKDETAAVEVINTYTPAPVSPDLQIQGIKTMTTDATDWNGAEFTFYLQKLEDSAWQTIATATVNEAAPSFSFGSAMAEEVYTSVDTYSYRVVEKNAGETIDGITYDATTHAITVTVTDADMDGKLEIADVTADNLSGNTVEVSFTNTYEAEGCTVVLDVQKALTNASGSPLVSLAGFRFELRKDGVSYAVTEPTDASGKASFQLHFTLADEGEHTFVLSEVLPDAPVKGMTYDPKTYTVTVTVTDNGDGTTSAAVTAIDGEAEYETPVFTNVYQPDPVQLPIDFVSKQLTGRDMIAGEFTFVLTGEGTVLNGSNDASGNVSFSGVLSFDKVGTYQYQLRENGTDGNGLTFDKTVYTVQVTVTDKGGKLEATYEILYQTEDTLVFKNTYTPEGAYATITGTKQLTGRDLVNEEFTFILKDSEGSEVDRVANFADGSFAFKPIIYTEEGVYRYQVSELADSAVDYGITFDTRVFDVTVTVTDNKSGALEVDVAVTGGEILFKNTYAPKPTGVTIPGQKYITGKVLGSGDFQFLLYASDAQWNQGEELGTASNDAAGVFTFSQLTYETAGTRYYLVKEANGGETINGVTYDDAVYCIRVDVVDDLLGQLVATVYTYDVQGAPVEDIVFRNLYTVTGEAQVELNGTKTLEGKELTDGAFTFALYEADAEYQIGETPLATTTNVDGKFAFTLDYNAQQVGNTYYYLVKEVPGNAGGISYDATEYHIQVIVTDDGEGNVITVVTTDTTDGVLAFVNGYTVTGEAQVELNGTKTLEGKELTDGAFTFALYEADAEYQIGETPLATTTNVDGKFAFTLDYNAQQVGNTYYYLVKEVPGNEKGITYDDTVYRIQVEVIDNGEGGVEALVTTDGVDDVLHFVNVYTAPTPPPQTGDYSMLAWYAVLLLSCGGVLTLLTLRKKETF